MVIPKGSRETGWFEEWKSASRGPLAATKSVGVTEDGDARIRSAAWELKYRERRRLKFAHPTNEHFFARMRHREELAQAT